MNTARGARGAARQSTRHRPIRARHSTLSTQLLILIQTRPSQSNGTVPVPSVAPTPCPSPTRSLSPLLSHTLLRQYGAHSPRQRRTPGVPLHPSCCSPHTCCVTAAHRVRPTTISRPPGTSSERERRRERRYTSRLEHRINVVVTTTMDHS